MTVNHETNGYLELQSGKGDAIPTVNVGSLVEVKQGTALVASGMFKAAGSGTGPSEGSR